MEQNIFPDDFRVKLIEFAKRVNKNSLPNLLVKGNYNKGFCYYDIMNFLTSGSFSKENEEYALSLIDELNLLRNNNKISQSIYVKEKIKQEIHSIKSKIEKTGDYNFTVNYTEGIFFLINVKITPSKMSMFSDYSECFQININNSEHLISEVYSLKEYFYRLKVFKTKFVNEKLIPTL